MLALFYSFGKHRKMELCTPDTQHYQQQSEFDVDNHAHHHQPKNSENEENYLQKNPDNNNLPERSQEIPREPLYQRHGFIHHHAEQVQVST